MPYEGADTQQRMTKQILSRKLQRERERERAAVDTLILDLEFLEVEVYVAVVFSGKVYGSVGK